MNRHVLVINKLIADMQGYPSKYKTCRTMAEFAQMSPAHFTRIFTTVTATNPQDYLHLFREENARKLLDDPAITIKEVSERCGFQCQNHFSAWFKRKVGCSPSDFREKKQGLKENSKD